MWWETRLVPWEKLLTNKTKPYFTVAVKISVFESNDAYINSTLNLKLPVCQRKRPSATNGSGRTPPPAPPLDSPPSPSCIPSMLSELGSKVLSHSLFSYKPTFLIFDAFEFLEALFVSAVNDGRVSHLPIYKNTAHAVFAIARSEVCDFSMYRCQCFLSIKDLIVNVFI